MPVADRHRARRPSHRGDGAGAEARRGLLVANLTGFSTARANDGWQRNLLGQPTHFAMDRYLEPHAKWEAWRGIRIVNWHRPLKDYMQWFLAAGLVLSHFDEPAPVGGPPDRADRYRRAPWYVIMEWRKP